MQVTVDIPHSLMTYIEYIPEGELPEVLLQALVEKIKAGNAPVTDTNVSKFEEVLSILNEMRQNPPQYRQEYGSPVTVQPPAGPAVTVTFETVRQGAVFTDGGEEDDDYGLFDDLMK